MNMHINPLLASTLLCFTILIGGCGRDSAKVTTITPATANGGEGARVLEDVNLPIIEDFRKHLRSGIGVNIVNAKAVGYMNTFMEGGLILFSAVIEIHGQQHPAKILIKTHYVSRGKNSDGPFVDIPHPGDSIQAICVNGTYYGPIENLDLD